MAVSQLRQLAVDFSSKGPVSNPGQCTWATW